MNVKKYLKQRAEEDLRNSETEEDRAFLQQLKDSVAENPPEKRRRKELLWAIPSMAACAAAAVLIVVLVPLQGVSYNENNFAHVGSDLPTLSAALDGLSVRTTQDQTVTVQRTYDSVSGDDIFYTLSVRESSESISYNLTARIVVNKKYEFDDFDITEEFVTESYAGYTVIYEQEVNPDPVLDLNLVECHAKVSGGGYDIYIIEYRENSSENGTFLTVIGNLFDFG